jgi:hypothetical protein
MFLLSACATQPRNLEYSRELGGDFTLKMLAGPPSSFEGITHHTFLYFKSDQIDAANFPCVSPSHRYAVYDEAISGELWFFDARTHKKHVLLTQFVGNPSACRWNGAEDSVELDFFGQHPSMTLRPSVVRS